MLSSLQATRIAICNCDVQNIPHKHVFATTLCSISKACSKSTCVFAKHTLYHFVVEQIACSDFVLQVAYVCTCIRCVHACICASMHTIRVYVNACISHTSIRAYVHACACMHFVPNVPTFWCRVGKAEE